MGLFNFFNRKSAQISNQTIETLPEVPADVFIETQKAGDSKINGNGSATNNQGIYLLLEFLERNYEGKGYDDALINPDTTHLQQNVSSIKNDLERNIRKVKIFYEDFIRDIDFHIASRARTGMVDTVEELTTKRDTAVNHIRQVVEIEAQAAEDTGVGYGIVLSYTRGFKNGLAAISHHAILRRNF